MMGDGVIDLPLLGAWAIEAGWTGLYEVEIFSALDWWTRDPDAVLATIVERGATFC